MDKINSDIEQADEWEQEFKAVYEETESTIFGDKRLMDWVKQNPFPSQQPESKHPEDFCQLCKNPNPVWYADNELWNKVNGSPNGIICPCCFQNKADELGINVIFKAETIQSQQPEIPEDIEKRIIGELFEWVKVTDKMSINRMEFGKVAKHISTALQQKGNNDSDAVEFKIWSDENFTITPTSHGFYKAYAGSKYFVEPINYYTPKDLYKLFKKSKL